MEMWEMPWYDTMMLYHTYEDYLKKEEEESKKREEEQNAQIEAQQSSISTPQFNVPNLDSLSRGFMNNVSIPKF